MYKIHRRKKILVEIKTNDMVLISKTLQKSLIGILFNVYINRDIQISAHLFQQVILKTDDRTLIHKIICCVIENQRINRINLVGLLFFVFQSICIRNFDIVSVCKQHDYQSNRGEKKIYITIVFIFQNIAISIGSAISASSLV